MNPSLSALPPLLLKVRLLEGVRPEEVRVPAGPRVGLLTHGVRRVAFFLALILRQSLGFDSCTTGRKAPPQGTSSLELGARTGLK